jgi:hypothetical protein
VESAAFGYVLGAGGGLIMAGPKKAAYKRLIKGWYPHKLGIKQAREWGKFCAAFTFFEGAVRLGRGMEDKWNGVRPYAGQGLRSEL